MSTNEPASRTPSPLDTSDARRSAARTKDAAPQLLGEADLVFVKRLVRRDSAAWSELTTKYRDAIVRGVGRGCAELGVTLTTARLEEVSAEVVFVLFKNDFAALRGFQGRSKFATWLTVVTRRVCLAKLLQHERTVPGGVRTTTDLDLSAVPERGSSTDLAEEMEAGMQAIQACLPQLSTDDRAVIERFFLYEQSYEEIAQEFGITKNAVGPKLTRARNRLRRLVTLHQQGNSASSQKLDPRNPNHGS